MKTEKRTAHWLCVSRPSGSLSVYSAWRMCRLQGYSLVDWRNETHETIRVVVTRSCAFESFPVSSIPNPPSPGPCIASPPVISGRTPKPPFLRDTTNVGPRGMIPPVFTLILSMAAENPSKFSSLERNLRCRRSRAAWPIEKPSV